MGRGGVTNDPDRIRPVLSSYRKPTPQDMWRGFGDAWTALSTIIAGIAVWGGIGYLIDRLAGTWPGFFAGGVIVGNFAAIYLVYIRMRNAEQNHAA